MRTRSTEASRRVFLRVAICFVVMSVGVGISGPRVRAQGWEPEIREFEEQDKIHPPNYGCIVFAGSSSFRYWDTLVSDMKPLDVINRGFGGSEFTDLNRYAKRIVLAYDPDAVVVYEGDNDLAEGSPKTPLGVAGEFQKFVRKVHSKLPDTWIYILSIKPSKLRWNQWPQMKEANRMMQDFAATEQHVQYIDVATPMFDASGNLPGDLFKSDGLHPSAKLYAMWTSIIKPILLERFGPAKKSSRLIFTAPSANSVFNIFRFPEMSQP